jgi:hypothetical protein
MLLAACQLLIQPRFLDIRCFFQSIAMEACVGLIRQFAAQVLYSHGRSLVIAGALDQIFCGGGNRTGVNDNNYCPFGNREKSMQFLLGQIH